MEEKEYMKNLPEGNAYLEDFLTETPSLFLKLGVYAFLGFIILLLLLANFVKYPESVNARAVMVQPNSTVDILSPSSGKLDRILIGDQDSVLEGQVIALLDNPADYTSIIELEKYLDTLRLEIDEKRKSISSSSLAQLGMLQNRFSNLQLLIEELHLYNKLNNVYVNTKSIDIQIAEVIDMNKILMNQIALYDEEEVIYASKSERAKSLLADGVISKEENENILSTELRFKREKENLYLRVKSNDLQIQQLKERQLNFSQNEKEYVRAKSIAISESIRNLKNGIEEWRERFLIKASIPGKLIFHDKWSEKQFINIGDKFVTIAPLVKDSIYAIIKMPEQNSGAVEIGSDVIIRLDSYNYHEYGVFFGKVDKISLTPTEGFYSIEVKLKNSNTTSYNKVININQNLQGSADIILKALSLLERIFYTLRSAFKSS